MTNKYFVLFRALTSSIFIYAGTNHLFQHEKIMSKAAKTMAYEMLNMPFFFSASISLSGVAMIISGLLLLFGYMQKIAAVLLLILLILITATVQLENLNDLGPFFKNVAISGSLLLIIKYKPNEINAPVARNNIVRP